MAIYRYMCVCVCVLVRPKITLFRPDYTGNYMNHFQLICFIDTYTLLLL